MRRKYKNAERELGWQYLFPSNRLSVDPRETALEQAREIAARSPDAVRAAKPAADGPLHVYIRSGLYPLREPVGTITDAQLTEIAEVKMPDLNTSDMDSAVRMLAGTARSMGIEVEP